MISDDQTEVDGSLLEGGGQILRVSITLSILLKKKLRIFNIRGNRSNPGLQRQHLAVTTAICNMTNSELEGAKISSQEIRICPGDINNVNLKNNISIDCNGAGSIGLLIQQILPCIIFSTEKQIQFEMKGGTIVSHSPTTFYCLDVLKPILKLMNVEFSLDVKKHGLFPIGGGLVNFVANPVTNISPINITSRGKLNKVFYRIASTNNFEKIKYDQTAKEIFKQMKAIISKSLNIHNTETELEDLMKIEKEAIQLYKVKNTFTMFGQIILYFENTIISVEQLYSEKREDNTILNFISEFLTKLENILISEDVCLDEFTVDHLIIFMALAKGISKIHIGEISKHSLTALEIVKQFIPDIEIKIETGEKHSVIEIEGKGYNSKP